MLRPHPLPEQPHAPAVRRRRPYGGRRAPPPTLTPCVVAVDAPVLARDPSLARLVPDSAGVLLVAPSACSDDEIDDARAALAARPSGRRFDVQVISDEDVEPLNDRRTFWRVIKARMANPTGVSLDHEDSVDEPYALPRASDRTAPPRAVAFS